ncbi:MAG: 3-methyladenine DNA glycosylase [Marmoricola sp.]
MTVLDAPTWQAREAAHQARVDRWIRPHLERRQRGEKHPVHDFLFTYYSQRPAALRRWHPGYGVQLAGRVNAATDGLLRERASLVRALRNLLAATAARPPTLGCFGLHEWAMVYRGEDLRHDWPLRLGRDGTDAVVTSHRIACSHFDAFRFFAPSARPLNTLRPGRDDREAFEQPGCLHAGMDLYKHAFRLSPLVASELVADCFALAWEIRELDMRASPYDFRALGFEPVAIETAAGKQEYVGQQRAFAERGAVLRARLLQECERLIG